MVTVLCKAATSIILLLEACTLSGKTPYIICQPPLYSTTEFGPSVTFKDRFYCILIVTCNILSTNAAIHPAGPQSGDIRLFGDTRNGHGAVQIYTITNSWQGICPDSSWTSSDAEAICQDLGYQDGTTGSPVDINGGPGGQISLRQLYDADCEIHPASSRSADRITAGVCSVRIQSSPDDCLAPEGRFATVQCGKLNFCYDMGIDTE